MRRTPFTFVAVVVALGVSIAAGAPVAVAVAQTQRQANEAAARHDVIQHLHGVRLPSTATSISTEPGFAKPFATTTSPSPGRQYQADDHGMWATSASPQAIISYVRAHAPAGSTSDGGTGAGSDTKTGVHSVDIQFSWPDLGRQLLDRTLTLTVVTPRHGSSVVVAQSQSSWFVPRSPAELVPGSVRAVVITLRLGPAGTGPVVKPGPVRTSTYVVWRSARVRSLVGEVNGLPIIQPGAEPIACPMMLTGSAASELTVAFKTGRHGATVAKTEVSIHHGKSWDDGAGPCNPIDFWIAGKPQTSLTSPTFVKQVGTLIGADIS
jgi:hypothetical protein